MKLFVLEYVDGCPGYDMTDGVAVLAETEELARRETELMSRGDNARGDWLDSRITSCIEIDMNIPGIVLASFRAG